MRNAFQSSPLLDFGSSGGSRGVGPPLEGQVVVYLTQPVMVEGMTSQEQARIQVLLSKCHALAPVSG